MNIKSLLNPDGRGRTILAAVVVISVASAGFHSTGLSSGTLRTIGLISKVVSDVSHSTDPAGEWNQAERGNPLSSGDRVKTGMQSLAVLKFRDASFLRVRENSEVVMTTADGEKPIVKTIETDAPGGSFGFDIKKQVDAKFQFTSPTSVASIRGTTGKWSAGSDANDTLWLGTGLVALLNKISQSEILVRGGSIAFSNSDGTITVRPMTPAELAEAKLASDGGTERNLDLRFRNDSGEEKDLKIKFKH